MKRREIQSMRGKEFEEGTGKLDVEGEGRVNYVK